MIGKFKFRILLVLAAAVLLASCSQDEVMTDTGPDGLVPVTLSVAVGDGVQTRATTTDEGPLDRCLIQILEKEKDEAEWKVPCRKWMRQMEPTPLPTSC